jgi:hypothetical protein
MINKENRFDEYSYRVAYRQLNSAVTALEEGQWVTIKNNEIVIADGTQKSFLCTSSIRAGRDQISGKPVKKAAYLFGTFELSVTNFNPAGAYGDMVPLKVMAGGILTPGIVGTDIIEAYAMGLPVAGVLRICSKQ